LENAHCLPPQKKQCRAVKNQFAQWAGEFISPGEIPGLSLHRQQYARYPPLAFQRRVSQNASSLVAIQKDSANGNP
jgi:hypothetical protein